MQEKLEIVIYFVFKPLQDFKESALDRLKIFPWIDSKI